MAIQAPADPDIRASDFKMMFAAAARRVRRRRGLAEDAIEGEIVPLRHRVPSFLPTSPDGGPTG